MYIVDHVYIYVQTSIWTREFYLIRCHSPSAYELVWPMIQLVYTLLLTHRWWIDLFIIQWLRSNGPSSFFRPNVIVVNEQCQWILIIHVHIKAQSIIFIYPLAIKHGVLENWPMLVRWFSCGKLHSVRDFLHGGWWNQRLIRPWNTSS